MKRISKVYVAAASSDIARAKYWTSKLVAAGLDVTSTWPAVIEKIGDGNPRDATRDQRCQWSSSDLYEVKQSDLVWFLAPTPPPQSIDGNAHVLAPTAPARGAYYECGFADALDKTIVTSGDTLQSVFLSRTIEHVEDLDAFAWICRAAKDGIS